MEHSIAMDINNYIYCWGSNEFGQCALPNNEINDKINIPTKVKYFSNLQKNIINIKAGSYHSGSISDKYKYYIWGCNDYNECCLKQHKQEELDDDYRFIPNCINEYVIQG
eukprot:784211_1